MQEPFEIVILPPSALVSRYTEPFNSALMINGVASASSMQENSPGRDKSLLTTNHF